MATCLYVFTKTLTAPYHLRNDDTVERFNRKILTQLSVFVDENQVSTTQ